MHVCRVKIVGQAEGGGGGSKFCPKLCCVNSLVSSVEKSNTGTSIILLILLLYIDLIIIESIDNIDIAEINT